MFSYEIATRIFPTRENALILIVSRCVLSVNVFIDAANDEKKSSLSILVDLGIKLSVKHKIYGFAICKYSNVLIW